MWKIIGDEVRLYCTSVRMSGKPLQKLADLIGEISSWAFVQQHDLQSQETATSKKPGRGHFTLTGPSHEIELG